MAILGSIVIPSVLYDASKLISEKYERIVIYGAGTFDKTIVYDHALTTDELDNINSFQYATWDSNTVMLAEYTNNLLAGALMVSGDVNSWNVLRYEDGLVYPSIIALGLPSDIKQVIDYTALNNNSYYYTVTPMISTSAVAVLTSDNVDVVYETWILLDDTTGECFALNLNLDSGTLKQNTSVSQYDGFTKYPAMSQSQQEYMSTTIQCFLGYMSDYSYNETIGYYHRFIKFISNGNTKILKDRKGDCWRVYTSELSAKTQDAIGAQPKMITFNVTEVGDV